MNIFDTKINNSLIFDVLYKRRHHLVVKRLRDSSKAIIKYFKQKKITNFSADDLIDYAVCKYILEIVDNQNEINELKEFITKVVLNKYEVKPIVKYIEENYLHIRKLTKNTQLQIILIQEMIDEIKNKNIKQVSISQIFKVYPVDFFDKIDYFYYKNKNTIFKTLYKKQVIGKLVEFRLGKLLVFIRKNKNELKNNKYYSKIIENLIESIECQQDIYRKTEEYLQLIYLLEELKDVRVTKLKEKYKLLLKEKLKYIEKNGIKIENKIDMTEEYNKIDKMMQDINVDEKIKLIRCFLTKNKNRYEILLNRLEEIKPPITDILITNCHSYYRPFKKMCFENIYLKTTMSVFFYSYIKNCEYNKLEEIISNLIKDIYVYIIFEKENIDTYKQESKNIVLTIKRHIESKENIKFDSYVNSFYLINFLEKTLRDIFIKACLNRNIYVENCTLKDIFDENYNKNLRNMLGQTLYRWLKYYLYHDNEEKDGFIIEEGMDIRNNIAHKKYIITENFNGTYEVLLYLTMNLLWQLEMKMLVQPTETTERILKKIFRSSI